MKIIIQFTFPDMTLEQYEKIWEDLRTMGHKNPNGLISHIGTATDKGWIAIDVWESIAKFHEFERILMPILADNGIQEIAPTIMPLHYMYSDHLVG